MAFEDLGEIFLHLSAAQGGPRRAAFFLEEFKKECPFAKVPLRLPSKWFRVEGSSEGF